MISISNDSQNIFRDKKGSLTLETAILLPIFIIGIILLSFTIRILYIQETVHQIAGDQAQKLSVEAEILPQSVSNVLFGTIVNNKLKKIEKMSKINLKAIIWEYDKKIYIDIRYPIQINLPLKFAKKLYISDRLVVRKWSGKIYEGIAINFSEMEKEVDSDLVYIFPKAGEKYHKEKCFHISSYAVEGVLTEKIIRKYKPCKLCKAKELRKGDIVYYYTSSGKVYHKYNCIEINKYVIKIPKVEASGKGYMPCKQCN